ncbi:MAG: hypothetical protein ABI207_03660 [Crocinitomicaceae bacterium]
MTSKIMQLKEEFSSKAQILEDAAKTLKSEFVGIDNIIDEVIENVRSWYILSEIQEKPAVINLWGLTGTGKTSLVIRLMELIDFQDKTYRFDLGEKDGSRSFKYALSELCENKDNSPIAIILDELQHARTLTGPLRQEISNDQNRMIWELIDSGKVSYVEWKSGLWSMEAMSRKLNEILNAGVRVKNGIVVKNKELYCKEMNVEEEEGTPILFVQECEYETIISLAGEFLKINLKQDVKKLMLSMNGIDTINLLRKVINIATRPSVKSFSKAIIFVLGNVDEAYTMSGNFSADISADEFHDISLKINIPNIKNALRKRFRDEQIARLGNIHIIYPALSSSSYTKIIQLELSRLEAKIYTMLNIKLEFELSLVKEIYKEGVYPTQGARPLFTTIHQMVKSKLALHFNILLKNNLNANRLVLSAKNGELICDFYENQELKFTHSDAISYNLENLRTPKMNDEQVVAAVHEAGHAVLSIALMQVIPELIISVTSDPNALGFMYSKNEKILITKNDLLNKTAMLLGGIVAEELIFGEEYLTSGGGSDIEHATQELMIQYKENGFSKTPISYGITTLDRAHVYHDSSEIENEVKIIIESAKVKAKETLINEKQLLLAIAEILSTRIRLEKEEIIELIKINSKIKLSDMFPVNYYREALKRQVETTKVLSKSLGNNPLILNKDKK